MNDEQRLGYVAALEKIVFKKAAPAGGPAPSPAYLAELERRARASRDPQTEAYKSALRREAAHKAALAEVEAKRPAKQELDLAWWMEAERMGRRMLVLAMRAQRGQP